MADSEWLKEATEALATLQNPHAEKKRATIIALVDARISGVTEESVWRLPGVCNRGTYHWKWKKDPVFAAALERVDTIAHTWKNERAVRALNRAAEMLAIAAPAAAMTAVQALQSSDDRVRLSASFGILDRASKETATKVGENADLTLAKLTDDDLERIARGDTGSGGTGTPAATPGP